MGQICNMSYESCKFNKKSGRFLASRYLANFRVLASCIPMLEYSEQSQETEKCFYFGKLRYSKNHSDNTY